MRKAGSKGGAQRLSSTLRSTWCSSGIQANGMAPREPLTDGLGWLGLFNHPEAKTASQDHAALKKVPEVPSLTLCDRTWKLFRFREKPPHELLFQRALGVAAKEPKGNTTRSRKHGFLQRKHSPMRSLARLAARQMR